MPPSGRHKGGSGSLLGAPAMGIPAFLEITFKETFNIPVDAATTQFLHRDPATVEIEFDRAGVRIGPVTGNPGRNKFGLPFKFALTGRIVFFEMNKEVKMAGIAPIPDSDDVPLVLSVVSRILMFPRKRVDGVIDRLGLVPGLIGFGQDEIEGGSFAIVHIVIGRVIYEPILSPPETGDGQRIPGIHPDLSPDAGRVVKIKHRPGRGIFIILVETKEV